MTEREIKFRIQKRDETTDWYYFDIPMMVERGEKFFEYYDYETLCQYTGRKDKNGTGIYERDILLWKNHGSVEPTLQKDVVSWKDKDYILGWYPWTSLTADDWMFDIEIIGDIVNNPELAKT